MTVEIIKDRTRLAAYLNKHAGVNVYHIGDLDDLYWQNTTWYAYTHHGEIKAVALLYKGLEPPILLAIDNQNQTEMTSLLGDIFAQLPKKVYTHISPNFVKLFQANFRLTHYGEHHKMILADVSAVSEIDTTRAEMITAREAIELSQLFDHSYPDHAFHQSMLASGHYWAVRENAKIVASAGVHVFSEQYRVAAIGNVVTHPNQRGKGLGTIATAALCKDLLPLTDTIGLNVKIDNAAAISLYKKLGFEVIANYHEYMAE